MKKHTNIILFGLACLVLVGYIFSLRSDIAGQEKKMATLKRERDIAWKTRTTLEDENKSLRQKMRNLQDLLTQAEARLAGFKDTVKKIEDEPVNTENQENELDRWLGKITQLKNFIKKHPEYAISEFKYLTDQDWLAVTQGVMETEADYRKTLAKLRVRAKINTTDLFKQAISDFSKANNGNQPRNYEDVIRYLPEDFDYSRYIEVSSGKIPIKHPSIDRQQWIIKDAGAVDGIWDAGVWISAEGGSVMTQISYDSEKAVSAAIKSYENEYGGKPNSSDDIIKYIKGTKMSKTDIDDIYRSLTTPVR